MQLIGGLTPFFQNFSELYSNHSGIYITTAINKATIILTTLILSIAVQANIIKTTIVRTRVVIAIVVGAQIPNFQNKF